jgi:hypothetical protein
MSEPTTEPTTAQLKADIDAGRTGDKVSGHDPAAAPLGTDDEAAGTPPSPGVIAQARAAERSSAPKTDASRTGRLETSPAPDARTPSLRPAMIGAILVGVAAALLLGAVYFVLLGQGT